jgi:peptidoglycan-associated lipoprotein
MKLSPTALLVTAAVALSACSKKQSAENLPPPPPSAMSESGVATAAPTGGVGSSNIPGSQADLIARAGADRVLFAYDSHELSGEARDILARQAQWLRDNPSISFTIEGHADERGTREYNLALGDRRANAVKNYLASQGVATARLRTISYGKERPEVPGSDDESFAQNRRAVSTVGGAAA